MIQSALGLHVNLIHCTFNKICRIKQIVLIIIITIGIRKKYVGNHSPPTGIVKYSRVGRIGIPNKYFSLAVYCAHIFSVLCSKLPFMGAQYKYIRDSFFQKINMVKTVKTFVGLKWKEHRNTQTALRICSYEWESQYNHFLMLYSDYYYIFHSFICEIIWHFLFKSEMQGNTKSGLYLWLLLPLSNRIFSS